MPFVQGWEPAPKNPDLKVIAEDDLPAGIIERSRSGGLRIAYGLTADEKVLHFHYCEECGGWVEGYENHYNENSLGYLSGRRGHAYYCARCGECISFNGIVS